MQQQHIISHQFGGFLTKHHFVYTCFAENTTNIIVLRYLTLVHCSQWKVVQHPFKSSLWNPCVYGVLGKQLSVTKRQSPLFFSVWVFSLAVKSHKKQIFLEVQFVVGSSCKIFFCILETSKNGTTFISKPHFRQIVFAKQ